MAFYSKHYVDFLGSLLRSGREFRTVREYLFNQDRKSIVIRHDVDRHVKRSVAIARLECELGVSSSYYFRYRDGFPNRAIREICALGHEVGFHYETYSDAKGDTDLAVKMFLNQLDDFRSIADCHTICAHGRPLSKWFSGEMAEIFLAAATGLSGDASESMPQDMVIYLTDAGGKWNDTSVNLRDKVGVMPTGLDPLQKGSMTQLLDEDKSLYVNTHPERWCDSLVELIVQSIQEIAFGGIKRVLKRLRD